MSVNPRIVDNHDAEVCHISMNKFPGVTCFILFMGLMGSQSLAGNWTVGMKAHSEFKEVVESMRTWENGNLLRSIELKGSSYTVKTDKCEFKVEFKYQQDDPEKGIKRTLHSTKVSGETSHCRNFFKN